MTEEELHAAWIVYRATNGRKMAAEICVKFGAPEDEAFPHAVPEAKWPELMAALTGKASASRPMSLGETQQALAGLHHSVWDRWNHGWKRPR